VVDLTQPDVVSILRLNPANEVTSETTLTWRIRFSEEVTGLKPSDFVISSTSASVISMRINPLNRNEWDVAISGGNLALVRSDVGLRISPTAQLTDLAGNLLSSAVATGATQTYRIDRSNPTVVISTSAVALGAGNPSASISFSLDFEASNNFTVEDISVVGGTLSNFSGSGLTFSATLTATSGFEGTGRVSIRSGVFTSTAGNPNRASVDLEIPIDLVSPTVVSVDRFVANGAYGVGSEVDVVVNFSEPITVTGTPSLLLETGTTDRKATFLSSTQSQIVFRYTVQAGDNSTDLNYHSVNALNLEGGAIFDVAQNNAVLTLPDLNGPNALKSRADLVIDTVAPVRPGTPTITIAGGRLVSGFINTTNTNVTAQATVTAADYTFGGRAELLANGVVVASTSNMTSPVSIPLGTTTAAALQALIPEGAVSFEIRVFDGAGNYNTSSAVVRTADFTLPTVTISSSVPSPIGNSNFNILFEWSEAVTGFNCVNRLTYLNVTRAGCSVSSNTFTTTATPTQNFEGQIRVEMVASNISTGIFDAAGNPAPATTPLSLILDSKAPTVLRVERVSPNGIYGVGSNIDFRVVFNEPINLSGFDASNPSITVNASTSAVAYVAGTTSDSIIFRYTVRSGDATNDLNYSATNALSLGGFTVRDAGNNNAVLTLPATNLTTSLAGSAALEVRGVPPTAPVIQALTVIGGNVVSGYVNTTNTNITVASTFTPSQLVGGRIELHYGSTVVTSTQIAAGASSPITLSLGTANASQLQQLLSNGPATFSVVLIDSVGNTSSASRGVIVDFERPTLTGSVNPNRSLGYQEVATLRASSSEGVLFQGSTSCANSSFTIVGGTVSCVVWPQSQSVGSSDLQLSFSPNVQGAWSVTFPAGLLRDRAGNDSMPFSLTGVADTVRPKVLSVTALSANGIYKAGDRVSVLVSFDEVVQVTGPTSLSLEVSPGNGRDIAYHSGSGTSTLRFDYTVQASDTTADLNLFGASPLSGAIFDLAGNPGDFSLANVPSLASVAAIVVDGRQPAKPSTPTFTGFAGANSQGSVLNSLTTNLTFTAAVTSESNIARGELLLDGVVVATDLTASSSNSVTFDLGAASNATIRNLIATSVNVTVRMVSVGGNFSQPSDPLTITADYTNPTISISSSNLTLSAQATTATITITLSEDSSNFEVSDLLSLGGTLSSFTANSSTSYTATFTTDGSENWSIRSAAGSFTDAAQNPSLASNVLLGVADTSVPSVTNIRFLTPNGTYKAGDSVQIEVAFSERVQVVGVPVIEIRAGDRCATVNAVYLSGSGTTKLVFQRLVSTGDDCLNVKNVVSSITVTGASIIDAGGNAANLSIATLPDGVNVNADAPAPPLAPVINTDITSSTQVVDSSASTMNIVIDLNGSRASAGLIKLFFGSKLFATTSFAVNATSVTIDSGATTQLELQTLLEPLIASSTSVAVRAEISDDAGNFTTSPSTTLTAYWLTTYAEKATAQQLIESFTESPGPTSFSYLAAGVEGVTEEIVPTLNEILSGMPAEDRNDFPSELNEIVAVVNKLKAIAEDTNGSYSGLDTGDLATICPNTKLAALCSLSGSELDLFNSLVAEGEFAGVDTAAEINVLASFAEKVIAGSPMPTVAEFQAAGFGTVDADNLQLVWEELVNNPAGATGRDSHQEIAQLVGSALAKEQSLLELANFDAASTSAPTQSTYDAAGVDGVTASNIELVNSLLREIPAEDSDSVAKLNAIVVSADRLRNLADGTPDGESTLTFTDLENLGVTSLPNSPEAVALMNSALDGQNLAEVDSVSELDQRAEIIAEVLRLAALDPADGVAPASSLTEADLDLIGVTYSAPATLAQALLGIASLPNDTSTLETIADIQGAVNAGIEAAAEATALNELLDYSSSSPQAPTVEDYSEAGILGVTSNNVGLVNEILEAESTEPINKAELQALVNSVDKLLQAADGVDNDSVTLSAQDFENLGINPPLDNSLERELANNFIDELSAQDVDTYAELSALANAIEKLVATAEATSVLDAPTGSEKLTLQDLELLGVTGITSGNLETFLQALIDDPASTNLAGSKVTNLEDLQDLANKANLQHIYNTAAQVIAGYDGNNTAPTKTNYQDAGVVGVTDANLTLINGFVGPLPAGDTDSQVELQAIVDTLGKLVAGANETADGNINLSQAELRILGVHPISASAVALINSALDVAELADVDSPAELTAISDLVHQLLDSAATGLTISPALTVSDFAKLGVSGVDANNIDALLTLIAESASDGSEIDTLAELNLMVAEAANQANKLAAIDKIATYSTSDTALTVADYLTAGITSFSPSLLGLVNDLVANLPTDERDTLAEQQAISDAANKLRDLADGVANDGVALTSDEWSALGFSVSSPAELSLASALLDGKNILAFEDKGDIQEVLDVATALIEKAAGGADLTLEQLQLIGLNQMTEEALPFLNERIAATSDDGLGIDSNSELSALVSLALADAAQAAAIGAITNYGDNNAPAPILANYLDSQITGVNSANLALINSWFDGISASNSNTVAKIQGIVDAITAIEAGADTLDNNSAAVTNAHLQSLGLPTLSSSGLNLLNDIIDRSSFTDLDTYVEISNLVAKVSGLNEYLAGASTTSPTVADFEALGVTGVNSSNRAFVSQALVDAATDFDSTAELQNVVDAAIAEFNRIAALEKISEFDGSNATPSVDDYRTAGVTGITDGNLSMVNSFVAQRTEAETDTTAEVQELVNAVGKIRAGVASSILSPNALTQDDLEALDISGGENIEFRSLLNDVLSKKQTAEMDTFSELDRIAEVVQALLDTAAGLQVTPALTHQDMALVGVTGVTSGNLASVLDRIAQSADDGSGVNLVAKAQAITNAALNAAQADAAQLIIQSFDGNNTVPTVTNYQEIGVFGVTSENLSRINLVIAEALEIETNTFAKVQSIVDAITKVESLVDGTANTGLHLSIADLLRLGAPAASSLTAPELALLNTSIDRLFLSQFDTPAEVQAVVGAVSKILTVALGGNPDPALASADFSALGFVGVTDEALLMIDIRIRETSSDGSGVDSYLELKAVVDAVLAEIAAANSLPVIVGFVAGGEQSPLDIDYSLASISLANNLILGAVNQLIALRAPNEIDTRAELQNVVGRIADAMTRVTEFAEGTGLAPRLSDFEALGITGVTAGTLSRLNTLIGTAGLDGAGSLKNLQLLANQAAIVPAGTPGPTAVTPETPISTATASPVAPTGAEFAVEDVVLSETGNSLVIGVNAGSKVVGLRIVLTDSSGRIKQQRISAGDASATVVEITRGRTYDVKVYPVLEDGTEGKPYTDTFKSAPRSAAGIDATLQGSGKIGIGWAQSAGFIKHYRVLLESRGKVVEEFVTERQAIEFTPKPFAVRVRVIPVGEGGTEGQASSFVVSPRTVLGAVTSRFANRQGETLVSFAASSRANPTYRVFLNGKLLCTTRINSCATKLKIGPTDQLRVVSSDGAISPTTNLRETMTYAGELRFIPNTTRPANGFTRQLQAIAKQIKRNQVSAVRVTGHANQVGSIRSEADIRLGDARSRYAASRLQRLLPKVNVYALNRGVESPVRQTNSGVNIRAEVYVVFD
jgi:hypothetical protein